MNNALATIAACALLAGCQQVPQPETTTDAAGNTLTQWPVPAAAGSAQAQPFPSKPVTILVPFAAGGITDIVARVVGERMKTALGQSVIIENVGGAGGTIAVSRLHRSPADG